MAGRPVARAGPARHPCVTVGRHILIGLGGRAGPAWRTPAGGRTSGEGLTRVELVVDLDRVTVVLAEPTDGRALAVRVAAPEAASGASEGDVHRLHDVLVAANVGRLVDPSLAVVRADAVRFHAAGQVDEWWEGAFAALCRRQAPGAVAGDPAVPEEGADRTAEDRSGAGGEWLTAPVQWPSGR